MKISPSVILTALLVLISCGKPPSPPHRDFAKMATLVKEGMTKEEVISAIGKPDMNSLEDPELSKGSRPGNFIFSYHEGIRSLIVSFRKDKVARTDNIVPPAGLEKDIRDTGAIP